MLKKLPSITESRIKSSNQLDRSLSEIPQIQVPQRMEFKKHVYHLYCIRVENRDELVEHLISKGIDAKVHYPIPMHLQCDHRPR